MAEQSRRQTPIRRPGRGLKPLRAAQRTAQARDAETEARLRGAWELVVGPALKDRTRMLRVRRGILVIGAWDLARIQSLRQAAAATWPEVRAKLLRFMGVELAGIEVEPCDPPVESAPRPAKSRDPLRELLGRLRK